MGRDTTQIRDDMGKFFLQHMGLHHTVQHTGGTAWLPPTDIVETDEALIIRMELAGVDKHTINVELEGTKLTISGERPEDVPSQLRSYYQVEINYGRFERVILLPDTIDGDQVTAEYDRGFLLITIAKKLPVAPSKPLSPR